MGILSALAMLAPVTTPAAARPLASPCGGYFYLYTFTVEAEPRMKVYERGEVVKVDMLVTRPGPEDPGGNGIPIPEQVPRQPVEGAIAEASFWAGNFYVFGSEETDAEGRATVKLRTVAGMPPGPVDLPVSARKYYNRGGCPDGEEVGYNSYPKAFTLR